MANRVVFVDRDGTIAWDVHYCRRVEDFELLPTVPQAIRVLNENGFKVVVITNQSGVARGYFTEETLEQIHQKMKHELAKHNAWVDAIYYCPHHPDDGCDCRKPKTALFLKAAKEFDIDLTRSYVVGDMHMDIEAGRALGCKTILVSNDHQSLAPNSLAPDHVADNLLMAAERIISDLRVTITIIVPTLNEERNLAYVLPKIPPGMGEILLVDGHSTDNTVAVAKKLSPGIRVAYQDGKGKGNAINCGAKAATGDYFLVLDADGSQDPEEIPLYIKKAEEGYDLVKGSRYLPGARTEDETLSRKILIKTAQTVANKLWRTKFSDICYGMLLVNRRKYLDLHVRASTFDIEWELMAKAARKGLRIAEVPAVEKKRIHEESHLSCWRDGWRIAKAVFREALNGLLERPK
jgi:D,D-heptose 1,7-bisphosphate phosphatase